MMCFFHTSSQFYKKMRPEDVEVVVYHDPCKDGLAAACVAYQYNPNIILVPLNHAKKEEFFIAIIKYVGKQIAFFDCVPSSTEMLHDLRSYAPVMIQDHHSGNLETFKDEQDKTDLFFDMSRSGCMLAWDFFFPGKQRPLLVDLIGKRDMGDFNSTNQKIWYALADVSAAVDMKLEELNSWILKGDQGVDELLQRGEVIATRIKAQLEALKANVQTGEIQGQTYKICVCEIASYTLVSDVDFVLFYTPIKEGGYRLSFRTSRSDLDLAKIAQSIGGGGHRAAAGAGCEKLPWGLLLVV